MAYNPNQPRDYRGRWTSAGSGVTYRQNTSYQELMSLDFFSDRRQKKNNGDTAIPEPPREVYGFANRERLNTEHHVKHAQEMGYKTQREYEAAAIEFWKNGEGRVYYSRARDRFYKYDSKSERKIVVSRDGIVNTYMVERYKNFSIKVRWDNLEEIK